MNSLNSIILEGNVVRDPVMKTTSRGTSVCTFSLASNRFYRQDSQMEQEVSFFDVESWGKLAESCATNCPKGRGVRIVGRLRQDRWAGTDGKNYSRVKVIAEHVEFKPQIKKEESREIAAEPEPSGESSPGIYRPEQNDSSSVF